MVLRLALSLAITLTLLTGEIAAQTSVLDIPHRSEWDHNGSRMRVEREGGTGRIFLFYEEPKATLRPTISPNAKLFEGTMVGGRVSGTAWVFKRGCAPAAYLVEGQLDSTDPNKLTLRGPTPVWDGCRVVGYRPNGAHSQLVFTRIPDPSAGKPWAETASCQEQLPLIDRVLSATRVTFSTPRPTSATVGERVTVNWTTEGSQRPVPVYLVVTASGPVRVDPTDHAIVLLPKARFPFGLSVEEQSTRILVPLYGGVPRAGRLSIELLTAGSQRIQAIGIGYAQPCRETRRVSRGDIAFDVEVGRPTVLAAPDADISSEPKLILSNNGERLLRIYPTWFQLIEMPSETEIARIEGSEPRFSPTGRFVAFEAIKVRPEHQHGAILWSVFGLADAVDGKILSQLRGEAVLWDLQDSYMLLDRSFLGRFTVHSAAMSGASPCDTANIGYQPVTQPGGGARFNLENSVFEVLDISGSQARTHRLPLLRCAQVKWDAAATETQLTALISGFRNSTNTSVDTYEMDNGNAIFNVVRHLREHEHVIGRVREPSAVSASGIRLTVSQKLGRFAPESTSASRSNRPADQPTVTSLDDFAGTRWRSGPTLLVPFRSASDLTTFISSRWPQAAHRFRSALDRSQASQSSCGIGEGIRSEQVGGPVLLGEGVVGAFEIGRSSARELLVWVLCESIGTESSRVYDNIHVISSRGVADFGPVYGNSIFKAFAQERREKLAKGDVGVWLFGDDLLLAANKVTRAVELIQWSAKRTIRSWSQWPGTARLTDVMIDPSGKLLLQIDGDGSFFIHRIADGSVRLRGRIVDDEVVVWTDDGHYDATGEGGHLVSVRLPGRPGTYAFHQFERGLRVPGLARKILAGEPLPKPAVRVPPLVSGDLKASDDGRVVGTATVDAPNGVRAVHVYQDGVLTDRIEQITDPRHVSFDVLRLPGARWTTLLAVDLQGLASQPIDRDLGPPPSPGRMSVLSIGVNYYRFQDLLNLKVAVADAGRIIDAVKVSASAGKREVGWLKSLTDRDVTRASVLAAIEEATKSNGPGDTLVLSFSGHGVRDAQGRFYLTAHDTKLSDLPGTAISWADLAASFAKIKGRIVILLDACHSGMAGSQFFATNDDIAGEALATLPSHVVVFAASKGREFSYESADAGGGLFSLAIADVIAGRRAEHDLNQNGMIEISELLLGVKQRVVIGGRGVRESLAKREGWPETGTQTPWIARNLMVGDFSLF